ncbi:MAG: 6,7-dimethyl-8-ribityllumazine synthase [Bauldia sp.]|nr:6,7-dimethyl-8-ribityllumazine synthase [Bauldia sp.]
MVAVAPSSNFVVPRKPDIRVLVIDARFYEGIADALFAGAAAVLEQAGAKVERVSVPGVLEVPTALAMASGVEGLHDGYVLLGCVIRGETTHYDIVAGESARVIADLSAQRLLAVGNGILTVENEAQAWARARATEQDKGGGAAKAALAMIALREHFYGVSA